MAKTKKEGWINIHRFWSVGGKAACSGPWESQKEAESKKGTMMVMLRQSK